MRTPKETFDESSMRNVDALAEQVAELFARERLFGVLVLRRAAMLLDDNKGRQPKPDREGTRGLTAQRRG